MAVDYSHLDVETLESLKKTVGEHAAREIQAELDRRPDTESTAKKPGRVPSKRPSGPDPVFMVVMEEKGYVPEVEHRFHPVRRWRFDYAWPEHKVALEVEGGVFVRGRHSRGAGFRKDAEKYNTATVMGWRVLRVLPEQLVGLQTINWLMALLDPEEDRE